MSPHNSSGASTPSENRGFKQLNELKRQYEERVMDLDLKLQDYLKLGNRQSDFLKVLKQREEVITEYFHKCFGMRSAAIARSSMLVSG